MGSGIVTASYIGASILFILSLGGLSNQETSRRGNLYGMAGMALAILATIFSDNVNTNFVPFQVSRITFSGNTDFFTVNDQMTVFHFNGTVETAVSGVIFQHVCHVISV